MSKTDPGAASPIAEGGAVVDAEWLDGLAERLAHVLDQGKVVRDLPLDRWCTYRVGGPAALAVLPRTGVELEAVMALLSGRPFFVLGLGSNVLVSDSGVDVPVVVTAGLAALGRSEDDDFVLWADSGTSCTDLAALALEEGLSGLEFFHRLPGSVGGAAYMNARAFGQEVSQVLVRAKVVSRSGEALLLDLGPSDFSYKRSPFMGQDWVIERLWWHLEKGDRSVIEAKMKANEEHRRRNGEMDHPSCGCVFKNPPGRSAGAVIDDCGMKGFRIGGAWVSERHANFVVHDGAATARDIRAVAEEVRRVVREKVGVDLEYEVQFVGMWDPKDRG